MCNNLSGPTKLVCCREVSSIKGVCYKRFHCTYTMCMQYLAFSPVVQTLNVYPHTYVRTYVRMCVHMCVLTCIRNGLTGTIVLYLSFL